MSIYYGSLFRGIPVAFVVAAQSILPERFIVDC